MAFAYHQDEPAAAAAVERLAAQLAAHPERALCLDFEWDSHQSELPLSLVQAAVLPGDVSPEDVHLFDGVLAFDVVRAFLMAQLASPSSDKVVKVLHDARGDTRALKSNLQPTFEFRNLFDTQVAHQVLTSESESGLGAVIKYWLPGTEIKKKEPNVKRFMRTPGNWTTRPLPLYILEYAADDVRHLPALYVKMKEDAERRGLLQQIFSRSEYRAKGKSAQVAAVKESAYQFFVNCICSDPHLKDQCADKEVLKSAISEWKMAEEAKGCYRHGTANEIITALVKGGKARVSGGSVVAFATSASRRGVSAKALVAAARRVEANRSKIEADKGGLSVSHVSFPESVRLGESAECNLHVTNTSAEIRMVHHISLLRGNTGFSVQPVGLPVRLAPESTIVVRLQCRPLFMGMVHDVDSNPEWHPTML